MEDRGSAYYEKYLSGDDQGMVELIRDYKDGLILYLNSITGNICEAEELAIDTFIRIGIRKPKNKHTAGFKTWLYTIGRNIAIDHLRKKARSKELSLEVLPEQIDEEAYLEKSYLLKERRIILYKCMGGLNPQYRQILWMIYFEQFNMKQAAAVLKKSVHSTQMLAHRARVALRTKLEKEGFEYDGL